MRKMKGSGNYLKNQVRKNLAKSVLCLMLFGIIFIAATLRLLFSLRLDLLDETGLLLSIVPLAASYFYLHKYKVYSGGWAGEKRVTELLSSKLSDDYILINDLCLQGGAGDIDHVVLGPSDIFVLETKNWRGEVACKGDEWQRAGKNDFKGSPSRQVKRNAAIIRSIIGSSPSFRSIDVWVEGIVVFTNTHVVLHLSDPSVLVLKIAQLPQHINVGNSRKYSNNQLEDIAKEILKHRR